MDFSNKKEYEQFIEIATILKYYKSKNVPIPEDVLQMLEEDKDSSEVISVLYDMATN